jgi:hypothetical protein
MSKLISLLLIVCALVTGCRTAPKQSALVEVEKDVWTESDRPPYLKAPDARIRFQYRIDFGR